jgi:phosphate-selective porin OprO and OprP
MTSPLRSTHLRCRYGLLAALTAGLLSSAPAGAAEPGVGSAPRPDDPPARSAKLGAGVSVKVSLDKGLCLQLGFLTQARYDVGLDETATVKRNELSVKLARPALRGHVLKPWVRVLFQPELAGPTPRLLDLEVDVQPVPELGVKVGQMVVPFSRAYMTPVAKLQLFGFSLANDTFRANRDTGAMAYGFLFGSHVEYYAGVFNGNGINQAANDNTSLLWVGRLAATLAGAPPKPTGHLVYDETEGLAGPLPFTWRIGAGAYGDDLTKIVTPPPSTTPSTGGDPQRPTTTLDKQLTMGVDTSIRAGNFSAQVEGYLRRELVDAGAAAWTFGADVQAGYFLVPRRLELGARQSVLVQNENIPAKRARGITYEGQLAYYPAGNHLKVAARYVYSDVQSPVDGYTGRGHLATIQTQLWF